MSVYNPDKATKASWAALVEKQSKGLTPDEFTWFTPEDIPMKVLYTAEDTAELPYTDTMPGLSPYIRGPQATMYAGRRWTIRQYAGFSTAEESNAFYRRLWRRVARVSLLPLISQPTEDTTPITHE